MKKLMLRKSDFHRSILMSLFLSLVLFIIPGCGKDPIVNPIPVPTIELKTSDGSVPYMGSTTVYYHVYNGDMMTLNGESISKEVDSLRLINLTNEITITVYAKNSSGEASENITILVEDRIIHLPTILVIIQSQNLPIGGDTVTITLFNTYTDSVYCYFNNKWYAPNSIVKLFVNQDTTEIRFEAKGPDGTKSTSVTVFVEQPPVPLTISQLLCLAPWQMIRLEFFIPGTPWYDGNIGCSSDDIWNFSLIPQRVTIDFGDIKCSDGEVSLSWPWTLNDELLDTGDSGGIISEITFISADTLVWVYCFGDGACTRETFVHPQNIYFCFKTIRKPLACRWSFLFMVITILYYFICDIIYLLKIVFNIIIKLLQI